MIECVVKLLVLLWTDSYCTAAGETSSLKQNYRGSFLSHISFCTLTCDQGPTSVGLLGDASMLTHRHVGTFWKAKMGCKCSACSESTAVHNCISNLEIRTCRTNFDLKVLI